MKATWPARQAACLALLALLFPTVTAAETRPDRVIATSSGAVAAADGEILAFKGMPYAAPPIGPLRWRPPQPPLPSEGVRDAARFRTACVQGPYVIPTGQEATADCLTINGWTATRGLHSHQPVMGFIYGGAFIGGCRP